VIKKALCVGLFSLMVLHLSGQMSSFPDQKDPGYAFLDLYIKTFQGMAASGTGGKDIVEKELRKIMAQANSTRAENKTDPVFHARFSRLMTVTLLSILPDPENIFAPILNYEISRFIKETIGKEVPSKDQRGAYIGQLAQALAMATIDLRLYLDNRDKRNKMWEELAKGSLVSKKDGY